jgi:hypothetical protein
MNEPVPKFSVLQLLFHSTWKLPKQFLLVFFLQLNVLVL